MEYIEILWFHELSKIELELFICFKWNGIFFQRHSTLHCLVYRVVSWFFNSHLSSVWIFAPKSSYHASCAWLSSHLLLHNKNLESSEASLKMCFQCLRWYGPPAPGCSIQSDKLSQSANSSARPANHSLFCGCLMVKRSQNSKTIKYIMAIFVIWELLGNSGSCFRPGLPRLCMLLKRWQEEKFEYT